jgi:hypothetical protein
MSFISETFALLGGASTVHMRRLVEHFARYFFRERGPFRMSLMGEFMLRDQFEEPIEEVAKAPSTGLSLNSGLANSIPS